MNIKSIFLLLSIITVISGQEFKQFIFPEANDGGQFEDDAAEVSNVRGSVSSGVVNAESSEVLKEENVPAAAINDPGRPLVPQTLSALPSVQYPQQGGGYPPQPQPPPPPPPPQPLQPNP
uniref:Uncharacterized protein n=1 Tax=Panagrolaimus superbus TaxID=310955 RepID=A0A914YSG2_9BILA